MGLQWYKGFPSIQAQAALSPGPSCRLGAPFINSAHADRPDSEGRDAQRRLPNAEHPEQFE